MLRVKALYQHRNPATTGETNLPRLRVGNPVVEPDEAATRQQVDGCGDHITLHTAAADRAFEQAIGAHHQMRPLAARG